MTNYYSSIMDKVCQRSLKKYILETMKCMEERISKGDVVVVDQQTINNNVQNDFDSDDRETILNEIDNSPIIPAISLEKHETFTLEEVFRSQNMMLMNISTSEYYFVLEFFGLQPQQCEYIFNAIFANTTMNYLDQLVDQAKKSYDCVAILLMILINEEFKI